LSQNFDTETANPTEKFKSISFIIPVYNEKNTIMPILNKIKKLNLGLKKEIIIVDDGSTDGSRLIIETLLGNYLKIFHDFNKGKGAALRSAIKVVSGDLVVIQDADLEYDPEDIRSLLKPILDGYADVVYGSRFLTSRTRRILFFWHMVGNKFLTLLTNMVTDRTFTDIETCYKLFRSNILKSITIEENRFGFEPEITIKISQLNCRIYEVGISYFGRTYAQGKKIGWKDGVAALRCIVKYGMIRRLFNKEPFLEKFLSRFRLKKVLDHIDDWQVVCDIGCGKHMNLLKTISSVSRQCIGIDKKIPPNHYSNIIIKTLCLDNRIPLGDQSVDVVTLLAVLEHLDKEVEIIQEIRRILKSDGKLLITVPTEKAKPALDFLSYKLHLVSKEEIRDHKRYYTVEKLEKLLMDNGFVCAQIETFEFGFNLFCYAEKAENQFQ